jgi:hypothetical protein
MQFGAQSCATNFHKFSSSSNKSTNIIDERGNNFQLEGYRTSGDFKASIRSI